MSTDLVTDPNRYGWRVWGVTPDYVLRSPFGGARAEGNPAIADCTVAHRNRIAAECGCGVHYVADTRTFLDRRGATGAMLTAGWDEYVDLGAEYLNMGKICIGLTGFAVSFGVALGQVEKDWMVPSAKSRFRTAWYHMMQLLVVDDDPELLDQLRGRYRCPVTAVGAFSVEECLPVSQRLRGTVASAGMRQLDEPVDHFVLRCPEPPPRRPSDDQIMQVLEERLPADVFDRIALGRKPRTNSVPANPLAALLKLMLPPPPGIDPSVLGQW